VIQIQNESALHPHSDLVADGSSAAATACMLAVFVLSVRVKMKGRCLLHSTAFTTLCGVLECRV
jgi:hypothetical protein